MTVIVDWIDLARQDATRLGPQSGAAKAVRHYGDLVSQGRRPTMHTSDGALHVGGEIFPFVSDAE